MSVGRQTWFIIILQELQKHKGNLPQKRHGGIGRRTPGVHPGGRMQRSLPNADKMHKYMVCFLFWIHKRKAAPIGVALAYSESSEGTIVR